MNHGRTRLMQYFLIAAILSKNQAEEYLHLARELGLSVLFEVHDLKELEAALSVNADIIGINNRDLKTLKIDLNNTFIIKKKYHPIKLSSARAELRPVMTYCALNQQALMQSSSEHHLWRQRI